jgi:hypothetical protein
MGLIIWGGVVPGCLLAAWLILRRPVRHFAEDFHLDSAHVLFRHQREWLEARFLTALGQVDPLERVRWDDAHWHNEVVWCRDRQTRTLLALIGVHFDEAGFDASGESHPHHATAIFEYRKGRWTTEGKRLDEIRPDEVMLRSPRFEPVALHPRRVY